MPQLRRPLPPRTVVTADSRGGGCEQAGMPWPCIAAPSSSYPRPNTRLWAGMEQDTAASVEDGAVVEERWTKWANDIPFGEMWKCDARFEKGAHECIARLWASSPPALCERKPLNC